MTQFHDLGRELGVRDNSTQLRRTNPTRFYYPWGNKFGKSLPERSLLSCLRGKLPARASPSISPRSCTVCGMFRRRQALGSKRRQGQNFTFLSPLSSTATSPRTPGSHLPAADAATANHRGDFNLGPTFRLATTMRTSGFRTPRPSLGRS